MPFWAIFGPNQKLNRTLPNFNHNSMIIKENSGRKNISILEDEIVFGGVTIGSTMKHALTLNNEGSIQATVFIDLERYPEFNVGLAPVGDRQQSDFDGVLVPVLDLRLNSASTTAPSVTRGKLSVSSRSKRKVREDQGEEPEQGEGDPGPAESVEAAGTTGY